MADSGSVTEIGAAARNPWPCVNCGAAVRIAHRAGRLPPLSTAALAGALAAAAVSVITGAPEWWLLATAMFLLAPLSIGLAGRRGWTCTRCGHRAVARRECAGGPSVAVAIPTYNNDGSIGDVVRGVSKAAPLLPLYVVDDGSTDATAIRVREAFDELPKDRGVLLRHPRNRGKGAAIRTALEAALLDGHSHVIILDGDGQHLPQDVLTLRAAVESSPEAIIVGERDLSNENVRQSSRFGRDFSNFWLQALTGARLPDSQCGFRVYPTAPVLSLGAHTSRFDYEVETLVLAARAGLQLRSVPIGVHYPPPQLRVSHFRMFWDNARISWVYTRLLVGTPLWLLGWPHRLSNEAAPSTLLRDWSGKSRGGAAGHQFFFMLMRLVGPAPGYFVLPFVALYFMVASRETVRASRAWLDLVLGPTRNPWTRFWRTHRHILTFAQCILDRAVGLALGPEPFTWVNEGEENLHRHLESDHGLILLSAHVGNYELMGTLGGESYDFPITVVMVNVESEAIQAVYQRARGSRREPTVIATNAAELPALQILSTLRKGEAVAMHGDRVIDPNWVWCDFMGKKAAFPTGAFQMAHAARVPIIVNMGMREGPRHYRFFVGEPHWVELPRGRRKEALAEHAQWYASTIENYARRYPYQWFNHFDFFKEPD